MGPRCFYGSASTVRPWNAHCNLRRKKIEIAAAVRLLNGIEEEIAITAIVFLVSCRCVPLRHALGELAFIDEQLETPLGYVETYRITVANETQRPANCGFGRNVEHDRAERGATHAGIGYAHHVFDALLCELARYRYVARLRHAGRAFRTRVLQHEHV